MQHRNGWFVLVVGLLVGWVLDWLVWLVDCLVGKLVTYRQHNNIYFHGLNIYFHGLYIIGEPVRRRTTNDERTINKGIRALVTGVHEKNKLS